MNRHNNSRMAPKPAFHAPLPVSSSACGSARFASPISVTSLAPRSTRPVFVSTHAKLRLHRPYLTASLQSSAGVSHTPEPTETPESITLADATEQSTQQQQTSELEQEQQNPVQTQAKRIEHPGAIRLISASSVKEGETIHNVATARAITPMRRPRAEDLQNFGTEEPSMPSQRRTDVMAPKSTGFWFFVPYLAAASVFMGVTFLARRRLIARQTRLVEEFGEVMALYGTSPEARRDIANEYKRKLGPGILRGAMFRSYLTSLVAEKPIVPTTVQEIGFVKRSLKLSDDRAVAAINKAGLELKEGAPSLLGKLLFLSQRAITQPDKLKKIDLVSLFPYSPDTVYDLQRNMLERCYKEHVADEIDAAGGELSEAPLAAAGLLQIDPREAQRLFDSVVLARQKKAEREAEEARLAAEAAEAEQESAAEEQVAELDSPARVGEPAKTKVHAYQCSDCGYTLFPAAGREFKFYGDDFVCPACGAPKDRFVDLNEEE